MPHKNPDNNFNIFKSHSVDFNLKIPKNSLVFCVDFITVDISNWLVLPLGVKTQFMI